MREGSLYFDRPVAPLQGTQPVAPVRHDLCFRRAAGASLAAATEQWTDPHLRARWLMPMRSARFTITHAGPAWLEAVETDGIYVVRVAVAFEDDGELTTVTVRVTPVPPITPALLIASGYTDRWEERLYALTDRLIP